MGNTGATAVLPATSQVNARLNAELKQRGDAGFAKAGITPSQAIRALWELAGNLKDEPSKISALLYPEQGVKESRELEEERARKLELIDQGSMLFEQACMAAGLPVPTQLDMPSEEELRNMAFREKFGEDVFGLEVMGGAAANDR